MSKRPAVTTIKTSATKHSTYVTASFPTGEAFTFRVVRDVSDYVVSVPSTVRSSDRDWYRGGDAVALRSLFERGDDERLSDVVARVERTLRLCSSLDALLARAKRYPLRVAIVDDSGAVTRTGEIRCERHVQPTAGAPHCNVWFEDSFLVPARVHASAVRVLSSDGALLALN